MKKDSLPRRYFAGANLGGTQERPVMSAHLPRIHGTCLIRIATDRNHSCHVLLQEIV